MARGTAARSSEGKTGQVDLFAPADRLLLVLDLVLLALSAWALADAAVRSAPAFPAAGKLTKPAWLGILAVCVLVLLSGSGLLTLVAGTAAIVYLVDVRPAVRDLGTPGRWR